MNLIYAVLAGLCVATGSVRADELSVDLAGGVSQNSPELTPFPLGAVTTMTDESDLTGFLRTSYFGDYIPTQLTGIQKRFDFDVSQFSLVTKLVFSWSGRYQWNPEVINTWSQIRMGPAPGIGLFWVEFGNITDDEIRGGSVTIEGEHLERILNGSFASPWIVGFGTTAQPDWEFISVETVEVSAVVTGTLIPVSVERVPWAAVKARYR